MTKKELKEIREALHRATEMVAIGDIEFEEYKTMVNGVSLILRIDAAITQHGTEQGPERRNDNQQ